MSTQRLAILAAVTTHNLMTRNSSDMERHGREHQMHSPAEPQSPRPPNGTQFHGNVNVLLGGAMLSVVVTMVCFVCYCCHRNLRKRSETVYRQRWLDTDANMEIYSVAQCYDLSPESRAIAASIDQYQLQQQHQPVSLTPSLPISVQGPPPSYETVVAMDQTMDNGCDKCQQMHRSCPYANCDHAHSGGGDGHSSCTADTITTDLQHRHHPHHHHQNRHAGPPPHFKLDTDEPNNNADAETPLAERPRIFNVLDVADARATATATTANMTAGRCNCELYGPPPPPQQQMLCCAGDDSDNYEFVKKCRHCGTEINSNNYCACFAMRSPTVSAGNRTLVVNRAAALNNSSSSSAPAETDNGNDNGNGAAGRRGERVPQPSTSANNNYGYVVSEEGGDDCDDADGGGSENSIGGDDCDRNEAGGGVAVAHGNVHDTTRTVHHHGANCPCESRRRFDGENNNTNNNNENGGPVDLDAFNEAGLIRMDMSQIIDQTGLPTYEAALKFESSGYV